ncbi:hypothetical protein [Flavobacterium sp. DG2-3]|uniref:hypothetical protein n=1 Tax=Flavobacterium sp. DG2-3 TaxID=3068317 RepID=UPI00273EA489|nr:hypothetical protein [Flavobacterium sp. DG2-3]MDP5200985.1 hypothetical protein [Flavobacterium sp. DG2-3]
MKNFLLTLLLITLNSCSSNYYFVNIDEDTNIYGSKDSKEIIATIPKGYGAYINTSDNKYRKVKWKKYKGWALNPVYSNTLMSSTSKSNSNYTKTNYTNNQSSTSGGSVHVKGYTRKDGTYVSPHTRSAPRRR